MEAVVRLGRDHPTHGDCQVDGVGEGAASVISAGASSRTPKREPNEDALFVLDDGERAWFGVADAHWGAGASALLIENAAHRMAALHAHQRGRGFDGVWQPVLAALAEEWDAAPPDVEGSESTLVLGVYNRRLGRGHVWSYGDSSAVLLLPDRPARRLNEKTPHFVAPEQPRSLRPALSREAAIEGEAGGLLLAFSDGVDECHYGSPDTSIGERHLEALFAETGPDPHAFAVRLADLALAGVDGNPGGEDNIALVVIAT